MTTPEPFADDLHYVQHELRWVRARAGRIGAENALERLERDEPTSRRFAADEPSPRALLHRARRAREEEDELRAEIDARLAAHREQAEPLALDVICERCGLDELERTVLLLAAGPCVSQEFEALYERLGAEEGFSCLTVEAAFAFAELSLAERIEQRGIFGTRAPLQQQDLATVGMRQRWTSAKDLLTAEIELSGRTFAFLVGRTELADEFLEFSSVEEPRARLEQVVLNDGDKARILSVVENHDRYLQARREWGFDECIAYGRGTMMLFWGPSGTGKTMTAHGVAQHLGKRVLNVDIPTFIENSEADRFLPGLFREARLQDAVLFFDECEAIFASRSRHGNALMTLLLTELERFEGVAVLATNLPGELDEALARRILVRVRFPEPDRAQRQAIWRQHLPDAAPLAEDVDVSALAARFELTGGLIKNAVLTAVAAAVHGAEDGEAEITMAHLEAAAEAQVPRLDAQGEPVAVPAARLRDVVLDEEPLAAVQALLSAVRTRALIQQRWGVGGPRTEHTGVAALLHGPPGTGKTLCAEALAGELGRPLRVGRAPALLSKWVGETERNLAQLFRQAQAERAVVLLDEADSLMGRRDTTEARHDLSMTNVLLDLVERYPGLVLLATNLPDRIDPALERRLTWKIAFGMPGAEARRAIWTSMLPPTAPLADDVDVAALSRLELTGAAIRTAALRAATRAAEEDGLIEQAWLWSAAKELATGTQRRAVGFAR